jgi:uncharacterized membrane protein YhaH (DUF805 family)
MFAGEIRGRYTEPRGQQRPPRTGPPPRFMTLKRLTMAAATAFLSINLWTGAPLLALWVGSHSSDDAVLSMQAVFVVVLVLAVLVFVMALALTWLNNTYDELVGRPRSERRLPWLRSMRAEAETHVSSRVGVTLLEQIVVLTVYVAVSALLIWFVFFAGSSLPNTV